MNQFLAEKNEIKEEIKDVEGGDIEDREMGKRRKWILEFRSDFPNKLPELEKYYEKDQVAEDAKEGDDD